MVQVGSGNLSNSQQALSNDSVTSPSSKKSPSFQSNKSENLSEEGLNSNQNMSPNDQANLVPSYEDHWSFETIVLERTPGISLGFSIAGGTDNPMYGNNTAIFITKLTPGGLAERDGRLRPNDILYKVNDTVLLDADHSEAVKALKEAGQAVRLVAKRLQPTMIDDVVLQKIQNGLGFSISGGLGTEIFKNDHGIFITKIIPGGSADLDGKLSVGDRLISVIILKIKI